MSYLQTAMTIPGAPAFVGGAVVGGAVGGVTGTIVGGATNMITNDKKTCKF